MQHITAAGNTEVPAYLASLHEGVVERKSLGESRELRTAVKGNLRVSAEIPLMVLGLFHMRRQRGSDWQSNDSEIEEFLKCFFPEGAC